DHSHPHLGSRITHPDFRLDLWVTICHKLSLVIGGFIVAGNSSNKVIMRAIGPSLPVAGRLADPMLEPHDSNGDRPLLEERITREAWRWLRLTISDEVK